MTNKRKTGEGRSDSIDSQINGVKYYILSRSYSAMNCQFTSSQTYTTARLRQVSHLPKIDHYKFLDNVGIFRMNRAQVTAFYANAQMLDQSDKMERQFKIFLLRVLSYHIERAQRDQYQQKNHPQKVCNAKTEQTRFPEVQNVKPKKLDSQESVTQPFDQLQKGFWRRILPIFKKSDVRKNKSLSQIQVSQEQRQQLLTSMALFKQDKASLKAKND